MNQGMPARFEVSQYMSGTSTLLSKWLHRAKKVRTAVQKALAKQKEDGTVMSNTSNKEAIAAATTTARVASSSPLLYTASLGSWLLKLGVVQCGSGILQGSFGDHLEVVRGLLGAVLLKKEAFARGGSVWPPRSSAKDGCSGGRSPFS